MKTAKDASVSYWNRICEICGYRDAHLNGCRGLFTGGIDYKPLPPSTQAQIDRIEKKLNKLIKLCIK